MACFSPLLAWQLDGGEIVFSERGKIKRELRLPCGQCIGCRLERSRQWAVRCLHESQLYDHSVFLTLTYNDNNMSESGSLEYRDFQLFMKRLRKLKGSVRFYMCGEYGEDNFRPHFHACLFNCFFEDREVYKLLPSGSSLYTSKILESLWPYGFSSIGDVTFESAAYVARYVMKKITGPMAEDHYRRYSSVTGEVFDLVPEFTHMSLKPGIGAAWFAKYRKEVYGNSLDRVVVNGHEQKPPRYYDNLLKAATDFQSDMTEFLRYERGLRSRDDSTPERLAVREKVARARLAFKVRTL